MCAEFTPYLVDLGLDEEELDERGRAVDSRVDVVQSEDGLTYEVKVLCQKILHPQQSGGGLLLPIICTHIQTSIKNTLLIQHIYIQLIRQNKCRPRTT